MNQKWFSFVEIIIVITIIILLAVIGVSMNSKYKDSAENTKISADIWSLKNALSLYKEEKKVLPLPGWNISYYDTSSNYLESWSWAFWIHWFITQNTLPKSYINYLPIDPRTNQYYGYGKTIDEGFFEIAWVNKTQLEYVSFVEWTYNGENWPLNLIREYNGPSFIYDGSTENFPYNPEERTLTASIWSFSWTVSINDTISDSDSLLSYTLRTWDTIKVARGWYATIYFSDGSHSTLGDASSDSELYLSDLSYPQENNLITKVKLALNIWVLWTEAVSLNEGSEFEVFTTDTTASVRGTIFWISRDTAGNTNLTVEEGRVKVEKIQNVTSFENLKTRLDEGQTFETEVLDIPWVTVVSYEAWEQVAYVDGNAWSQQSVDISEEKVSSDIVPKKEDSEDTDISNNVPLEVISIKNNASIFEIKLQLQERLKHAEYIKIIHNENKESEDDATEKERHKKTYVSINKIKDLLEDNILTINDGVLFQERKKQRDEERDEQISSSRLNIRDIWINNFIIQICKWKTCTRWIEIFLTEWMDITQSEETNTYYDPLTPCPFSIVHQKTWKCIENYYAQQWYELVGIADFTNKELDGKILWKGWTVVASPRDSLEDIFITWNDGKILWVQINDSHKIEYKLEDLHLWANYILELRVGGDTFVSDRLTQNTVQSFFSTSNSSKNYFQLKWLSSIYKKFLLDGHYHTLNYNSFQKHTIYDVALGNINETGATGRHFVQIRERWESTPFFNVTGPWIALREFETIRLWGRGWDSPMLWTIKWFKIYKKVPPKKEGGSKDYIPSLPWIPRPPQVSLWNDIEIIHNTMNSVELNGNFYDPDGWNHTYTWEKIDTNSGGILSSTDTQSVTISYLEIWEYEYKFSVIDETSLSWSDRVKVKVRQNLAPTARVQATYNNMFLTLNGDASRDPEDNTDIDYEWEKVSWPTGAWDLQNPYSVTTTATLLSQVWTYEYRLKVKDTLWKYNENTNNIVRIEVTQPTPQSAGWNGCSSCPNGKFAFRATNYDDDECGCFWNCWGLRDEYYCEEVFNPSNNREVWCARERRGAFSCRSWFEDIWWGWITRPWLTATITYPN